jgi:hypothetical protein
VAASPFQEIGMSLRRLNRPVKSLAEKGKPGRMARHITVLINPEGKKQEFHATKGWRRLA